MKHTTIVLLLLFAQVAGAASIANVKAQQRPKSDIVDVYYDLVESGGGVFDVSISIEGGGDKPTLSTLSGDVGVDIVPGRNKHIVWDAGADWPNHVNTNFVATVTASPDLGMVLIPGGTNEGKNPHTIGAGSNLGSYSLSVDSFYMDRTEVKYMRWKFVYDWAVAHGYQFDNTGGGKALDHPVQRVNWYDCVKWCNARSEMLGREPVYYVGEEVYRTGQSEPTVDMGKDGYRLPTSEEWEYAARGGFRDNRYSWSRLDTSKPGLISHDFANYKSMGKKMTYFDELDDEIIRYHPLYKTSVPYTAPVASFPVNGFGLYDMIGNVREWTGTASDTSMILRGGSWMSDGIICRVGQQQTSDPGNTNAYTGFRTVRRK